MMKAGACGGRWCVKRNTEKATTKQCAGHCYAKTACEFGALMQKSKRDRTGRTERRDYGVAWW